VLPRDIESKVLSAEMIVVDYLCTRTCGRKQW